MLKFEFELITKKTRKQGEMQFCCKANIKDERLDFKTARQSGTRVYYNYNRIRGNRPPQNNSNSSKNQKVRTLNRLASTENSSKMIKQKKILDSNNKENNWDNNDMKGPRRFKISNVKRNLPKPRQDKLESVEIFRCANEITNDEEHSAYRKMMLERLKIVGLAEEEYEDFIRYKKEALQIFIPEEKLKSLMVVINKGDFMDNFEMNLEEYEVYEEKFNLMEEKKRLIYTKPETSSFYYHLGNKSAKNGGFVQEVNREERKEKEKFSNHKLEEFKDDSSNFMRRDSTGMGRSAVENMSKSNPVGVTRRPKGPPVVNKNRIGSHSPVFVPRPQFALPIIQNSGIYGGQNQNRAVRVIRNSGMRNFGNQGNRTISPGMRTQNGGYPQFQNVRVLRRSTLQKNSPNFSTAVNTPIMNQNRWNYPTENPFKAPVNYYNSRKNSVSSKNSKIPFNQTTKVIMKSKANSPIRNRKLSPPKIAATPPPVRKNQSRETSITRAVNVLNKKMGIISTKNSKLSSYHKSPMSPITTTGSKCVPTHSSKSIEEISHMDSEVVKTPINTKFGDSQSQRRKSSKQVSSQKGNIFKSSKEPQVGDFDPNRGLSGNGRSSKGISPGEALFLDKIGNFKKSKKNSLISLENKGKNQDLISEMAHVEETYLKEKEYFYRNPEPKELNLNKKLVNIFKSNFDTSSNKVSFCKLNKDANLDQNPERIKMIQNDTFQDPGHQPDPPINETQVKGYIEKLTVKKVKLNRINECVEREEFRFIKTKNTRKPLQPKKYRTIEPEVFSHQNFNRNFRTRESSRKKEIVKKEVDNKFKEVENLIQDSSVMNQIMMIHGSSEFPRMFNQEMRQQQQQEEFENVMLSKNTADSLNFHLERASNDIREQSESVQNENYNLSFKESRKKENKNKRRKGMKENNQDTVFGQESSKWGSRSRSRRESARFNRNFIGNR